MAQRHDRDCPSVHGTMDLLAMQNLPTTTDMSSTGEDELLAEADEPPDGFIRFKNPLWSSVHAERDVAGFNKASVQPYDRRESLLTRALLTKSDDSAVDQATPSVARGMSNASTCSNMSVAELTSDGGITGPSRTNTPSPPLPAVRLPALTGLPHPSKSHDQRRSVAIHDSTDPTLSQTTQSTVGGAGPELKVEAGLGRKRCITFACGRKSANTSKEDVAMSPKTTELESPQLPAHNPVAPQPRRPCMVKFACPTRESSPNTPKATRTVKPRLTSPPPPTKLSETVSPGRSRAHRDSESTIIAAPSRKVDIAQPTWSKTSIFNDIDLDRSESTRFHEFASSVGEDDEWIHEATAHRRKITVDDVLQKEKVIRQMGEEAEEEALQDLEEEEQLDELADDDIGRLEEDPVSDDGNETDDEGGFADSDDESDGGSEYQFWTPGRTTAATSTDSVEHIRPKTHRSTSESSIESMIRQGEAPNTSHESPFRRRKPRHIKIRPGTPELPDSTDFVCGTLDEDRPLEDAYVSCMEERRRSKHTPIPQDIDPSFPTSEPDDEDELDEDANEDEEPTWISGQLDDYNDGPVTGRKRSPLQSPKRMHSPPAPKRGRGLGSPPPRRLFQSPPPGRKLHSPPPTRRLRSPPPTGRASVAISPKRQAGGAHIQFEGLAIRPGLVHTKSLPRTPNPFSQMQALRETAGTSNESSLGTSVDLHYHGRGAIDIVKGLERKRQRRREKLLQKWCQRAGKDKEQKPKPGKGAEKMKELGLEKAGKGTGGYRIVVRQQKPQYMLSV